MRVGVDHDLHARGRGRARVDVGQVAAVGVGVDLEHRAGARGGLDHAGDVEWIRTARLDLAPGGVAEGVDQRVLDRRHDAVGHLALPHAERRVHARDHPIETPQQLVRVVQRAVGHDVDLAAGQQLDPLDRRVGLGHQVDLALELPRRDVHSEAHAR